jgi:hypothetical protein
LAKAYDLRVGSKRSATRKSALVQLICDGRIRLERRNTSGFIHARAYIQGKLLRKTAGTANLRTATRVATAWWHGLSARNQMGEWLH